MTTSYIFFACRLDLCNSSALYDYAPNCFWEVYVKVLLKIFFYLLKNFVVIRVIYLCRRIRKLTIFMNKRYMLWQFDWWLSNRNDISSRLRRCLHFSANVFTNILLCFIMKRSYSNKKTNGHALDWLERSYLDNQRNNGKIWRFWAF